jgi:hypothetical protein
MATLMMERHGITRIDEVQAFLTGRYISTNEAVWRILGFDIHDR